MTALVVTPNPASPSTLVAVAGSGFANAKTRLLLDGIGATTNVFRPRKDGTFNVGITVASTAKTQTLVAQQLGSTWTEKARVLITVQNPAPVPEPVPATEVYGSAQGDSRNNQSIGRSSVTTAYRFRATTTSAATTIRVQQRGNCCVNTYSGGTGGQIRISIQSDASGVPSGTMLSSLTFFPGNPNGAWEVWTMYTFPTPATLTRGTLYHLVMENIDPAPNTNWISVNALFYFGTPTVPRQMTWSDDYAVLMKTPTTAWTVKPNDTPIMDLGYADGTHDGMNYIGAMLEYWGDIQGVETVRQQFTITGGDRTFTKAGVKVKRISGSSPLTIRLETSTGTLIDSQTVPAASIAVGLKPGKPLIDDAAHEGGNTWANITFDAPRTLVSGQTYNLLLTSPADTEYIAVGVQEGTTKGMLSKCVNGDAYKSADDGATWNYLYPYVDNGRVDLQFYLL